MFDIDKFFLSRLYINSNGGTDFKEGTHEWHANRLINAYLAVLKDSPNSFQDLNGSIDNDTSLLTDVRDDLREGQKNKTLLPYSAYTLRSQSATKNVFIAGKFGIGPFALNNNMHILMQLYGVKFAEGENIMSDLGLTKLGGFTDRYGRSILSWFSGLINAHVDAAKDPWIPELNVNKYTYNLVSVLMHSGLGKDTFYFTTQPIMRQLATAYENASGVYMSDQSKSKSKVQQEAEEEVIKNMIDAHWNKQLLEDGVATEQTFSFSSYNAAIKSYWRPKGYTPQEAIKALFEKDCQVMRQIAKKHIGEPGSQFLSVEDDQTSYWLTIDGQEYNLSAFDVQMIVVAANSLLKPYAEALSKLVQHTKIDTKKQGKNLIEQRKYLQGVSDLFDSTQMSDDRLLFDTETLDRLYTNSYILHQTKLATDLFRQIMANLMIEATDKFVTDVDRILKTIGNPGTDPKVLNAVQKGIMAKIKSKFFFGQDGYCERHKINPRSLVAGKNTIYDKLLTIKAMLVNDPKYKDLLDRRSGEPSNYLLRALVSGNKYRRFDEGVSYSIGTRPDTFMDAKFIQTLGFVTDESFNADDLSQAWDDLLQDSKYPELQQFARELVVYAFITSGDNGGNYDLFKYVPNTWRLGQTEEGVSYADHMAQQHTKYVDGVDVLDENDFEDVILNMWQDDNIVPKYSMYRKNFKIFESWDTDKSAAGLPVVIGAVDKKGQSTIRKGKAYIKIPRFNNGTEVKGQRGYVVYKRIGYGTSKANQLYPIYAMIDPRGEVFDKNERIFQHWQEDYSETRNIVEQYLGQILKAADLQASTIEEAVTKIADYILANKLDLQTIVEGGLLDENLSYIIKDINRTSSTVAQNDQPLPVQTVNFYEGLIVPDGNTVFVFGSNPGGVHGAGAAKTARDMFGALTGVGEGMTGNAYALPTKDLEASKGTEWYKPGEEQRDKILQYYKQQLSGVMFDPSNISYLEVVNNPTKRTIAPDKIVESIKRMYEVARQNPEKQFKVAYGNGLTEITYNGYIGAEMIEMFKKAGPIPSNVLFSRAWVSSGMFDQTIQQPEVKAPGTYDMPLQKHDERFLTDSSGRIKGGDFRIADENLARADREGNGYFIKLLQPKGRNPIVMATFDGVDYVYELGNTGNLKYVYEQDMVEKDVFKDAYPEKIYALRKIENILLKARGEFGQKSEQQPIEIWYGSNDRDQNRSNPDLSNLADRPFLTTLNGALDTPIEVKSVEHAFQLAKLYEMYDELDENVFNLLELLILNSTGAGARSLGRTGFRLSDSAKLRWDDKSSDVMKTLVKESFELNLQARDRLLATGNTPFTHTRGREWALKFPKILMEVRDELRAEQNGVQEERKPRLIKKGRTDYENVYQNMTDSEYEEWKKNQGTDQVIKQQLILQFGEGTPNAKLTELVFKALEGTDIVFEAADLGDYISGRFVASENKILYNPDTIQPNTILHEATHAAINYYLKTANRSKLPKEIQQAIKEIEYCYGLLKQDFIEQHFYENGKPKKGVNILEAFNFWIQDNDLYGYTSPTEMIAEISKPGFLEHIRDFDKRYKGKNIFDKLVSAILKLFGVLKEYKSVEKTIKDAMVTLLTNPNKELMLRYADENRRSKENYDKLFNAENAVYFYNSNIIKKQILPKLEQIDETEESSPVISIILNNDVLSSSFTLQNGATKMEKGTICIYSDGPFVFSIESVSTLENGDIELLIRAYSLQSLLSNIFETKTGKYGTTIISSITPYEEWKKNQEIEQVLVGGEEAKEEIEDAATGVSLQPLPKSIRQRSITKIEQFLGKQQVGLHDSKYVSENIKVSIGKTQLSDKDIEKALEAHNALYSILHVPQDASKTIRVKYADWKRILQVKSDILGDNSINQFEYFVENDLLPELEDADYGVVGEYDKNTKTIQISTTVYDCVKLLSQHQEYLKLLYNLLPDGNITDFILNSNFEKYEDFSKFITDIIGNDWNDGFKIQYDERELNEILSERDIHISYQYIDSRLLNIWDTDDVQLQETHKMQTVGRNPYKIQLESKQIILSTDVSDAFDKYLQKSRNNYPKEFYDNEKRVKYVKSNNYKHSRLYDIVDIETGEIIAQKLPLFTKDLWERKQESRKKLDEQFTNYNQSRSFAFKKSISTPSKGLFKKMAKQYLLEAIRAQSDVSESVINHKIIDDFVDQFNDTVWEHVITYALDPTHGPGREDSAYDSRLFGMATTDPRELLRFAFNPTIPKQGLIDEVCKALNLDKNTLTFTGYAKGEYYKKQKISRNLPYDVLQEMLEQIVEGKDKRVEMDLILAYSESTGETVQQVQDRINQLRLEGTIEASKEILRILHGTSATNIVLRIQENYSKQYKQWLDEKGIVVPNNIVRIIFNRHSFAADDTPIVRLATIMHEPFHALEMLHHGTEALDKVQHAFDAFLQTEYGKQIFEDYKKHNNEISGYEEGDLQSEFLADLFSLMMMPQLLRAQYTAAEDGILGARLAKTLNDLLNSPDFKTIMTVEPKAVIESFTEQQRIILPLLKQIYNAIIKWLSEYSTFVKNTFKLYDEFVTVTSYRRNDTFEKVEQVNKLGVSFEEALNTLSEAMARLSLEDVAAGQSVPASTMFMQSNQYSDYIESQAYLDNLKSLGEEQERKCKGE